MATHFTDIYKTVNRTRQTDCRNKRRGHFRNLGLATEYLSMSECIFLTVRSTLQAVISQLDENYCPSNETLLAYFMRCIFSPVLKTIFSVNWNL